MDIVYENNFNLVLTISGSNFYTTIKSTDCRKIQDYLEFFKKKLWSLFVNYLYKLLHQLDEILLNSLQNKIDETLSLLIWKSLPRSNL